MTAIASREYNVADYLRVEQETGEKYEFYNGIIKKMAGGTITHNRITRNLLANLGSIIAHRTDLEIFGSDQKIYLPKFHFYVYPDAVVIAGEPIVLEEQADAIVNPLLIIEILSPSSERYDRGQKFIEYQSLPSFREYVVFRQDAPEALLFFREAPDVWRSSEISGKDQELWLRSIEIGLRMEDVYHKVTF